MSIFIQSDRPIDVATIDGSAGGPVHGPNGEGSPPDAAEVEVQRILGELEAAPQEVQLAICARLLTALAAKLTAASAAKAVSAAKVPPEAAQKATGSRGGSKKKTAELGRIESRLSHLPDPTDPIAAWEYFGGTAEAVRAELRQEPAGVLQGMLRHDRMPPGIPPRGKTSASLADAIVARLSGALAGRS